MMGHSAVNGWLYFCDIRIALKYTLVMTLT